MEIIGVLSHGFIQRALIAGSFIAILCATLGTFLVLKRFSLIGDGLAHVTFGGVAIGLFLRLYPMYVAVPVVMISALGILKLVEKARLFGDAAIGIVSSLGIACGILLASAAGGFNVDLFSYLFGNILAISNAEVISSISLSVVLIFVIWFFYHELLSITFDEESAKASGVKTKTINTILVLLTSLTVVLAMRVVGIMLISSLLILPPVAALQIARGFRMTIVIASASGVLSVILGVFISLIADLPTGATIVILNFLFFLGAFISGKFFA
jgi:zinc transport system permease protein